MNIAKLQEAMTQQDLDAMLLFSPINIRYFSKFFITDGAAVITRDGAWMFTDSRYIEAAQAQTDEMEVLLFDREHPLKEQLAKALEGCTAIGAEEQSMPHGDWLLWEERLGKKLGPAECIIKQLRTVKNDFEIESIVSAQRIAEAALDEVLGLLHPGMSERELAAELTYRMLRHGGEGNSFPPIVVTGKKSSLPHGVPGDEIIADGDFVTMDFGCLVNGYCSDMTRTVAVGHATDEMRKVYDTVLEAQLAGIAKCRAGVIGAEVHNAAAKVIADAGYGPYFGHGFGHSLGLEVHEEPRASVGNDKPLPAGVVVTAEPGIYLPGKFGVRIEDMVRITEDGCENLTRAPKELIIVK